MKFCRMKNRLAALWSHPARGAWIEIIILKQLNNTLIVAPRKGCVD